MVTENILSKVSDKVNPLTDWNNTLSSLWRSDMSRPWDIYSKETFRRFWDERYSVDVEVRSIR